MTAMPSAGESASLMLRVLKYLESLLGYKLSVGIAQELGVSVNEVNAALRQLRIKGIIEQTRDANLKAAFRFNPSYGNRASELSQTEPEMKTKLTSEQEMLAMGSPTLFEQ